MDLRERKPDGWTTVTLDNVDEVTVASGKVDGHLELTLIGIQSTGHNESVTGVLDVDPDVEAKLSSEVPRTDDRTSAPVNELQPW